MQQAQAKFSSPPKNIALSSFGYWPKGSTGKYKFRLWFYRWLLKMLGAIILLAACSLVETSRLQTAKEMVTTAKEVMIQDRLARAFPVEV